MWVTANIRGGGEFGPKHVLALKEKRHKAFEDMASVVELSSQTESRKIDAKQWAARMVVYSLEICSSSIPSCLQR